MHNTYNPKPLENKHSKNVSEMTFNRPKYVAGPENPALKFLHASWTNILHETVTVHSSSVVTYR